MKVRFSVLALAFTATACTVSETPAPPLAGPSEMALALAFTATPDTIFRDGFSQSSLLIEARGPDGRPVRGLSVRLDFATEFDFGTLSARTVVTDDTGRARAVYTSPPRSSDPSYTGDIITLLATPIGNDYRGEQSRQVDIRLNPVGVVQPPNETPVARFTVSPAAPTVLQTVTFDASSSTDEGQPCPSCTYRWDFGDGSTGTGIFTTHQYRTAGNYQVRLTVTDSRGASASAASTVAVGAGSPPSASFTFSPTQPAIGQLIFFNASASRAVAPRQIVRYEWDFGSGRFGEGVTVSKGYETAGTYNVTLTVTDDAGQQGTTTQSVNVGSIGTGPTASLVISPSNGSTQTSFFFDASASRGPSPIVEYRFTFGDGSSDVVGTSPTTTHRYTLPGTYTARVTIRDSAGRTATATQQVSVQ